MINPVVAAFNTEAYQLIFKVWTIWSVITVNFSESLLVEGSRVVQPL